MQISLRISPETAARLKSLAEKTGKTKTTLVIEALNEKYGFKKSRSQLIHELAGWMPATECTSLREAIADFSTTEEMDWP